MGDDVFFGFLGSGAMYALQRMELFSFAHFFPVKTWSYRFKSGYHSCVI